MPEAMDSLLATPTISTRLPLRKPMGVFLFPCTRINQLGP
jgi:hypothetical protein